MVKKIFALVMVMSILGGIVAGCSGSETTETETPAAGDAAATPKEGE